ncbi:hypothetical protein LCGC14_1822570, partial [marine sediment metagenome]
MKMIIMILVFILIASMGFAGLDLAFYDDDHHHNDNPYQEAVEQIINYPGGSQTGKIVALIVMIV